MRLPAAGWAFTALLLGGFGCQRVGAQGNTPLEPATSQQVDPPDWTEQRVSLVEKLKSRGIQDERVLAAIDKVPRHELVPLSHRHRSYEDRPLPIGHEQTISQPYVVAFMSQAAGIQPGDKVLEVGTGSGYQAAVLAAMGAQVFSMEIVEALAKQATEDLQRLGIKNVHVRHGDGYEGWPEEAPFDAVVVTAAPAKVPQPLLAQLKDGGRLVIPVGPPQNQTLEVHRKTADIFEVERVFPVRFVPMTGKAQE